MKRLRKIFFLCSALQAGIVAVQAADFAFTTNFAYATNYSDNTITIIKYVGPGGVAVTIPDTINDLPTTCIGDSAFYWCWDLPSVTIPNSVTNIQNNAFAWCSSLSSITIPDSVTDIGDYAFYNCGLSLTGVIIGSGVTNIGTAAFSWCSSLPSITILANVTSIGDEAFSWCFSLTSVYFQGDIPSVGSNVFDVADKVTVYPMPGTTGWDATFGGRSVVLWNPQVQKDTSFGAQTNGFGFTITGSSNLIVVVEVCTNSTNPVWVPLGTNTLTGGLAHFRDSDWANHSARFYRLRTP